MFLALMKVAEDLRDVETVSLANNELVDVNWVTTLAQTYPGLKNLSLANNRISNMRGLEPWRHKFKQLRELILAGNPVVQNDPTYKDQILRMFPRLVILDGQVVRDESQLDVLKLPQPIRQTFFENGDIQMMATNFLANYFRLFDDDRQQLLQLYDDMSTFSLSVNSGAPRVLVANPKPQSWAAYISLSRNLQKVTTVTARNNRLYTGPQAIGNVFRRLPATKHDLSNASKFSIEAWRTTGVRDAADTGVIICVHGEYDEPQNMTRSFDRTFIVLPGPNGSMIVASDILTVRAWAGSDAWKEGGAVTPQPSGTPAPAPVPTSQHVQPGIPPELNGLTPEQMAVVEKLMIETRLTPQYARMCAEQANFDLVRAAALFQQSRQQLPPNAFT
jgi:nuclear RNA export factor